LVPTTGSERARLRVALCGAGAVGLGGHLPCLLRNRDVELSVVADRDPSRLDVAAELLPPDIRYTTDYADVLEDAAIDAVVLATPPWATPRLVLAALEADKYVLAEKPLATSLAELREFDDVDPGVAGRLQIGFTYRHAEAIEHLRSLVVSGELGAPLLVRIALYDEIADPTRTSEHFRRIERTLASGVPFIHEGAHACDWLNFLLGEPPEHIAAFAMSTDGDLPAANVNAATLRYRDGTTVLLEIGWLLPAFPQSYLTVTGSHAHAELSLESYTLTVRAFDRDPSVVGGGGADACFDRQLDRFIAAWRAGSRAVPGLKEATDSLALSEALCAAIEQRVS
jgi:predicted dehydrogenase